MYGILLKFHYPCFYSKALPMYKFQVHTVVFELQLLSRFQGFYS